MKAITGATMIDGTGAGPVRDATVVIEGDRITAAGPGVQVPDGAETIDASGMHLLPGLIDCHDHLANFKYELASRWRLTEQHSLLHLANRRRSQADVGDRVHNRPGRRRPGRGIQDGRRGGAGPGPKTAGGAGLYHPHRRHGRPHQPLRPVGAPRGHRSTLRRRGRSGGDASKGARDGARRRGRYQDRNHQRGMVQSRRPPGAQGHVDEQGRA